MLTDISRNKLYLSLGGKIVSCGLKIYRRIRLQAWKRQEMHTEIKLENIFRIYNQIALCYCVNRIYLNYDNEQVEGFVTMKIIFRFS